MGVPISLAGLKSRNLPVATVAAARCCRWGGKGIAGLAAPIALYPRAGGKAEFGPVLAKITRMNIAMLSQPASGATIVPGIFLDPVAIAIVLGGTVASMVLRNRLGDVARALAALRVLWRRPLVADAMLDQVAALERIARRHGLFSLDRSVIADPDMAAAIEAAIDGETPEQVEAIVTQRVQARAERHRAAIEIWTGAAEAAPAMGLVGTILGLVQMFATMTDPARIGAAMAVALLATLYGALLANLVALPIASRLKRLARAEAVQRVRLAAPLARLATLDRARTTLSAREVAA